MIELYILVFLIIVAIVRYAIFFNEKIDIEELNVTDDEKLLLDSFDESLHADLIVYVRTLDMSPDLQEFLVDKKDMLEVISYFMMLQSAKADENKKKQWEEDRSTIKQKPRTHAERMILKRLNRQ